MFATTPDRNYAIVKACSKGRCSRKEIADAFGIQYATVSRIVKTNALLPAMNKLRDDDKCCFARPRSSPCFAKGTLVHTKEGLAPIEKLKVGDWALSKPEDGTGEVAYKRVTQTLAHEQTEVVNLLYGFGGDDDSIFAPNTQHGRLTTTLNLPFWVVGQGWTEASGLSGWPGRESRLTLMNGQQAITSARESIFQTSTLNIGWTSTIGDLTDVLGGEWDFENECVHRSNVPAEDDIQDLAYPPLLQIPVCNIEVEDFHTYFVGKEGVWVHNKNLSTAIKVQNDGTALPKNTLQKATQIDSQIRP